MEREPFAVCVAIPAYNEAARIGKAIASIRRQTEPPSEIIVVDDGSSDETVRVAQSLGARVISQVNAGPAAARNRAIQEASAPWMAFCDADDVWLPEKLALTRRAHEMRPEIDFLFADHRTEFEGRVTLPSMFLHSMHYEASVTERLGNRVAFFERAALARGLARGNFVAPSSVVVRRALILERDVFFNPDLPRGGDLHVAEDIEWYLRVLKFSDALAVEQVVMAYHRHSGSLSANVGRINDGIVRLGEIVAALPERYVDGAAALYAAERRGHLREAAVSYARALQFHEAHDRLVDAQRLGYRWNDEMLRVITGLASLPGGLIFAIAGRAAWRHALKPAFRALPRRR